MKRFTASVLSLGLLSAASGVGAATLDFPDFSDLAAFQLNGTAATISNPANGNALRVTDPIIVNPGVGVVPEASTVMSAFGLMGVAGGAMRRRARRR